VESVKNSLSLWRNPSGISLKEVIDVTDKMQVIFKTSDLQGNGHLVEAAVDGFRVYEAGMPNSTDNLLAEEQFEIYPNPFSEAIQLELKKGTYQNIQLEIFNAQGLLLNQMTLKNTPNQSLQFPENLPNGAYWIRLRLDDKFTTAISVVKQ